MKLNPATPEQIKSLFPEVTPDFTINLLETENNVPDQGPKFNSKEQIWLFGPSKLNDDPQMNYLLLTRSGMPFYGVGIKPKEYVEDTIDFHFPFMDDDDEEHCELITRKVFLDLVKNNQITTL